MTEFTVSRNVSSPQAVVAPRVLTVLDGYAARDDFALTVDFGVARAALSVPVRLTFRAGRSPHAIPFALGAREHTDWFPAFHGEVRSEEQGPLSSRLRLVGEYEVPLGALGTIFDRHVLGSAAERSLGMFVDRLRADVQDEIRRSELSVRQFEGRY